jgi:hypothetical protein
MYTCFTLHTQWDHQIFSFFLFNLFLENKPLKIYPLAFPMHFSDDALA